METELVSKLELDAWPTELDASPTSEAEPEFEYFAIGSPQILVLRAWALGFEICSGGFIGIFAKSPWESGRNLTSGGSPRYSEIVA